MDTLLATLVHFAEPWKTAYAAIVPLGVAVVFGHLGALLIGGGVAVSTDLASLRAFRGSGEDRDRQLMMLARSHRIVIGALIILFVTGLLLVASDLEHFFQSPWLWCKLALVTLLVINGAVLVRTSHALPHTTRDAGSAWRRLRTVSTVSLVLWVMTVLAGVILQEAA